MSNTIGTKHSTTVCNKPCRHEACIEARRKSFAQSAVMQAFGYKHGRALVLGYEDFTDRQPSEKPLPAPGIRPIDHGPSGATRKDHLERLGTFTTRS